MTSPSLNPTEDAVAQTVTGAPRALGPARAWWQRLARRLVSLPAGRVLHLGADNEALVAALVSHGIDARAHTWSMPADTAPVLAERWSYGPFAPGLAPSPPFDTVVLNLAFDGDPVEALERALPTLCNACARHALILLAQPEERMVTATERRHVATRMLDAGFRRHPAAFRFQAYDEIAEDEQVLIFMFERRAHDAAPAPTAARHDLLLTADHAAEDSAARYALAASHVRQGDIVLCLSAVADGGAAILHDTSMCGRLICRSSDPSSTAHARAEYGATRPRIEFADAADDVFAHIADSSVDIVVAVAATTTRDMETSALACAALRVLIPGGRLVVAAPANGSSHGVPKAEFAARLEQSFRLEALFGQLSDVHPRTDLPERRIIESPDAHETAVAWWIGVGLKDPVTHQTPLADCHHPACHRADSPLALQGPAYRNPWIERTLVSIERRTSSPTLIVEFALRTLELSPDYCCDSGAALCVLGYRKLEGERFDTDADSLEQWLAAFVEIAPSSILETRWQISNAFVLGQLRLVSGDLQDAESVFARCAFIEVPAQVPTLAVKTAGAALKAGWLAHNRGDHASARRYWQRGVIIARVAVHDRWHEYLGTPDASPRSWAHGEASQILNASDHCQRALTWLDSGDGRRGFTGGLDIRPWSTTYAPLTTTVGSFAPGGEAGRSSSRRTPRQAASLESPGELMPGTRARPDLRAMNGRPIYVWGAGALGARFASQIGDDFVHVTAFIDSNPAKQGTELLGKPIVGPEVLSLAARSSPRPFIVVASQFTIEIMPRLRRYGYQSPFDIFIVRDRSSRSVR